MYQADVVSQAPFQVKTPNGSWAESFFAPPLYAGMNSKNESTTWLFASVLTRQCPAVHTSFSLVLPLTEGTTVPEQTKFPPLLVKKILPLTAHG